MDRIFVIQKDYLSKDNIDSLVLKNILDNYANMFMDRVEVINKGEERDILKRYATKNLRKFIPIGSISFVENWLHEVMGKNEMKPLEVPTALRGFMQREYQIVAGKDIDLTRYTSDKYFIKNADKLKEWNSLLYMGSDISKFIEEDTTYVVSEYVDMVSEYRVFVYKDKIEACQNYFGNPMIFPDTNIIEKMIHEYSTINRPQAYTLDVGVVRSIDKTTKEHVHTTEPVEVHPFVSCGLYGFYDKIVLDMVECGYSWYVQHWGVSKKQKVYLRRKRFIK